MGNILGFMLGFLIVWAFCWVLWRMLRWYFTMTLPEFLTGCVCVAAYFCYVFLWKSTP